MSGPSGLSAPRRRGCTWAPTAAATSRTTEDPPGRRRSTVARSSRRFSTMSIASPTRAPPWWSARSRTTACSPRPASPRCSGRPATATVGLRYTTEERTRRSYTRPMASIRLPLARGSLAPTTTVPTTRPTSRPGAQRATRARSSRRLRPVQGPRARSTRVETRTCGRA